MTIQTNIGQHLIRRAELGHDLEAVVDVAAGKRFTYGEINERADRLAEGLVALGLQKGDRQEVALLWVLYALGNN